MQISRYCLESDAFHLTVATQVIWYLCDLLYLLSMVSLWSEKLKRTKSYVMIHLSSVWLSMVAFLTAWTSHFTKIMTHANTMLTVELWAPKMAFWPSICKQHQPYSHLLKDIFERKLLLCFHRVCFVPEGSNTSLRLINFRIQTWELQLKMSVTRFV